MKNKSLAIGAGTITATSLIFLAGLIAKHSADLNASEHPHQQHYRDKQHNLIENTEMAAFFSVLTTIVGICAACKSKGCDLPAILIFILTPFFIAYGSSAFLGGVMAQTNQPENYSKYMLGAGFIAAFSFAIMVVAYTYVDDAEREAAGAPPRDDVSGDDASAPFVVADNDGYGSTTDNARQIGDHGIINANGYDVRSDSAEFSMPPGMPFGSAG